ncbi:PspA/IM30 family protein [Paenibacillus abyssi]|uniref:Phage shock protein A n=1 Tax=Paenibacillus abyssi TaxID=1340531 RepID=A0A917CW95_9BACL|nr:PspA/IM30 family protein [Paenibacillus abyssi]GGG00494.1 hypothetical protein GCM10010916_17090 [Paenibacillus abyssi]
MGIFGRVKEIASADMHSMLDRFEDPISMAKQYIRLIEEQIDKAREALTGQLAAEQQYDLLVLQTKEIVNKRFRQAELAVDRGEDGIAELALQDKLHHQKLLQTYEEQRDLIRKQAAALNEEIVRLADIHQELQSKLFFLLSRAHAARALEESASAFPSFETDKITRGFSRMEERVWRMEAGAHAYRQTSVQSQDELNRLDQHDEVRAELEKLKASRGK